MGTVEEAEQPHTIALGVALSMHSSLCETVELRTNHSFVSLNLPLVPIRHATVRSLGIV
jgi:hypothetical protein